MCARFTVLSDTPIAFGNGRLRHPTFAQQHHLDALAQRRMFSLSQRSFQPPQLALVAFDHLFAPNQMIPTNHILHSMKISRRSSARPP